jgi:hypothetical protein
MTLCFMIQKRANSRRTSYTRRDVTAALRRAGVHFIERGMFIHCRIESVEQRKHVEAALRLVHRNISYLPYDDATNAEFNASIESLIAATGANKDVD